MVITTTQLTSKFTTAHEKLDQVFFVATINYEY